MIHFFNRKELLVTYDQQRFNTVRDALAAAGIDYRYRTKDRNSPSPLDLGTRGRTGTFGVNFEANLEYKLYVRKADYPKAAKYL